MTVKGDLLDHYAGKEPCAFRQYDGIFVGHRDDLLGSDDDGDWLCSGATMELMTGRPEVRVLCSPGCTYDQALRLLRKVRRWIRKDGPEAWLQSQETLEKDGTRQIFAQCDDLPALFALEHYHDESEK